MSAIALRCTTRAMLSQSTTSSNASHFTCNAHSGLTSIHLQRANGNTHRESKVLVHQRE